MNNDIRELEINDLDSVVGGKGSLSDVAAYISGYIKALGTVPEAPSPLDICKGKGIICPLGFD